MIASARKNVPLTPVMEIKGQEHDDRRDRRPDQRHTDFADGAANGVGSGLSGITMRDDVLDDQIAVAFVDNSGRMLLS